MNSSYNKKRSLESAESYIEDRFKTKRMKKVDKREQQFAEKVALRIKPGETVMDIPCGSGRFLHHFSNSVQLFEADYDYNMLLAASNQLKKQDKTRFLQASITHIPVKDKSVNLVFCMRLMHHINSQDLFRDIFEELARVSKDWIAISFFRKESLKYLRRKILGQKDSGFTISIFTFFKMAKQNGFKINNISLVRNNKQTLVLLKSL